MKVQISNCPNLCGDEFQKHLSNGVEGEIFFCKKCLFVWSEGSWQKCRDEIIFKISEKEEKERLKRLKKRKRK